MTTFGAMRWAASALLLAAGTATAADWDWNRLDAGKRSGRTVERTTGETFLLTNAVDGGPTHALQRLAADGTMLWRREHPGNWGSSGTQVLRVDQGRVCVSGAETLEFTSSAAIACYALDDGALRWRTRLLDSTEFLSDIPQFLLRADGTILAVAPESQSTSSAATIHQFVLAQDGTIVRRTTFPARRGNRLRLGADGTTLFADGAANDPHGFHVVAADGTTRRRITAQELGLADARADLAPNGSVYAVGEYDLGPYAEPAIAIFRFDASGPGALVEAIGQGDVTEAFFRFSGDDAYLSISYVTRDASRRRLHALTAPKWERDDPSFLLFDPATQGPIAVDDERTRVAIRPIDRATGAAVATRRLPLTCIDDSVVCFVNQVHATADGSLRVMHTVKSQRDWVYSLSHAFAPRPAARVDQPGMRGAWYATYSPGQGFVFDYFPSTRSIFAAWFTFSRPYTTTPAGLRWYSLQGSAGESATRATLDILENRGGSFAGGPATAATRVGSATLELHDCANGTLDYAFDDGRIGAITLTRLTPATDACVLADGSTQPAPSAPRNGFDARQSGAWYVPAQSGQGTLFTVQPGGSLFGAWFTYDVASDDSTSQHWFSLQADLAPARQGRVTMPLYRSTGSRFDGEPAAATVRVGEVTVSFTGCDRATFDYAFDDTEVAAGFRRRTGSLALEKIGGCASP